MITTWAKMIDHNECEIIYLKEILSHFNFNDDYNFIVGRANTTNEVNQLEESIIEGKKNIFIMKSDEIGIKPPFLDRLYLVFRMYNNNNLVDYKKIFPIPCGFSRSFNQKNSINVYDPIKIEKKILKDRHYDIFYSGQKSYKRTPMIDAINKLKKKYNILINETDGFSQGYDLNQYYSYLSDSKISLVPEGAAIPESFRYFEFFERNCIVITTFPKNEHFNNWYYENSPAIFLNSWEDLNETIIDDALNKIDFFENENKKYFNNYITPKAVAKYMEKIINYKNQKKVTEYGWHFSWMGDSNRKKLKCKSFAHYSDYIESAEIKDLGSSQMETFFDEWEPSIGGINPWGNKNFILKRYDENKLPKEIWNLKNVREFLLGDSLIKEKTLIDLFLVGNYNTDKYQLGYITEFYNDVLYSLKETPINLLEIGTYSGGSAKLWRDYFHLNSNITTGDIIECKNKVNGVNYILGDLYSDEIISQFKDNYFDLIIDDGPHTFESFNLVIEKYYSKLKSNGTLIIEDVISESYLSPLIMLAKKVGYSSYQIIDMAGKQLNEEWRNDWKNGLYILRFDK